MQDQVFVFPFIKGNEKIAIIAEDLEEATQMVFCGAEHNEIILPLNHCGLDWNKRAMGAFQAVKH